MLGRSCEFECVGRATAHPTLVTAVGECVSNNREVHEQISSRERLYGYSVLICLAAFVGLVGLAMWFYPGGNWIDRRAPGHDFFANYFCDLTQPVSLSGVSNALGARCAKIGMLCFAFALAGFFQILPRYFAQGSALTHWVRWLGTSSVSIFVLVVLSPSERFGKIHGVLALASGVLGIAATLCGLYALKSARARPLFLLGLLTWLSASFDAGLFAYHLGDAQPEPWIVPAAQKLAAFALCAWMIAVVWPVVSRSPQELSRRH